jgi:hypothetical protein
LRRIHDTLANPKANCVTTPPQACPIDGDLPADADPADLARYAATIIHGMAVQAAGGATRKELLRVVATALRAWPE